jgi:cyanophycinase-like exopeptidase
VVDFKPGFVVLFGSGETSASGRKIFDRLFHSISQPIRVSILETPAGFELNSDWVAGQVADFLKVRLQNHHPEVRIIPARKRDSEFSPDRPEIVAPLLSSNVIYMGAGSPTYAVRQLQNSLAWQMLTARHRLGATIVLASASPLAMGTYTIPVYEIYKVGEDIHWKNGLDFFKPYGLSLAFVPHWNNTDGGENLDTSRCFMGLSRFHKLLEIVPGEVTIVGIEEHTALLADLNRESCQVWGKGGVTIIQDGSDVRFGSDSAFPITKLGPYRRPDLESGIPHAVLEEVLFAHREQELENQLEVPPEIVELIRAREAARALEDWQEADRLRNEIQKSGWQLRDTSQGPQVVHSNR